MHVAGPAKRVIRAVVRYAVVAEPVGKRHGAEPELVARPVWVVRVVKRPGYSRVDLDAGVTGDGGLQGDVRRTEEGARRDGCGVQLVETGLRAEAHIINGFPP